MQDKHLMFDADNPTLKATYSPTCRSGSPATDSVVDIEQFLAEIARCLPQRTPRLASGLHSWPMP